MYEMVSLICFGQDLFEFLMDRDPSLADEKWSVEAEVGHKIFACMFATILGANAKHGEQNTMRKNSRMSPAAHYMQTSELRSRASQTHDIASQKYVNGFEARSRFPGESGLLRLSFTAR